MDTSTLGVHCTLNPPGRPCCCPDRCIQSSIAALRRDLTYLASELANERRIMTNAQREAHVRGVGKWSEWALNGAT